MTSRISSSKPKIVNECYYDYFNICIKNDYLYSVLLTAVYNAYICVLFCLFLLTIRNDVLCIYLFYFIIFIRIIKRLRVFCYYAYATVNIMKKYYGFHWICSFTENK